MGELTYSSKSGLKTSEANLQTTAAVQIKALNTITLNPFYYTIKTDRSTSEKLYQVS